MSNPAPQILVTRGPLKDRRFDVLPQAGLRLGRSSSCEVSINDPALSRNHCLFELRADVLWVTDLASANGTLVNGETLGTDSHALKLGDRVEVGESELMVVAADSAAVAPAPSLQPAVGGTTGHEPAKIDLGLGKSEEESEAAAAGRQPLKRILIWVIAAVAVVGAAAMILVGGERQTPVEVETKPLPKAKPTLYSLVFEKVEADKESVYRYALSLDRAGVMTVEIDDVPKENRHVRKSAQLPSNTVERLSAILAAPELYKLAPEYTGVPLVAGTLKSFALRIVRGDQVFSTSIENIQEPEVFRSVREQLETFSKNELGIWAIQFSAEKLVEMSKELRRTGDAKWEEREVQYGNIAAALAAYNEAIFYLDTVNPKPDFYGELVNHRDDVAKELDKRYRDQRFRADRAINLADWRTAQRELRILCEMVPDTKDARHSEAASKLLDVENRMKKGLK